jgi:methionyl-tRNA synthetase
MVHRYRDGRPPTATGGADADGQAPQRIADALDGFDFRAATAALWSVVEEANRHIEAVRPWQLHKQGDGAALDSVLGSLLRTCRTLAEELRPFLPDAAARIAAQCTPSDGRLPDPRPLFPRIPTPTPSTGG